MKKLKKSKTPTEEAIIITPYDDKLDFNQSSSNSSKKDQKGKTWIYNDQVYFTGSPSTSKAALINIITTQIYSAILATNPAILPYINIGSTTKRAVLDEVGKGMMQMVQPDTAINLDPLASGKQRYPPLVVEVAEEEQKESLLIKSAVWLNRHTDVQLCIAAKITKPFSYNYRESKKFTLQLWVMHRRVSPDQSQMDKLFRLAVSKELPKRDSNFSKKLSSEAMLQTYDDKTINALGLYKKQTTVMLNVTVSKTLYTKDDSEDEKMNFTIRLSEVFARSPELLELIEQYSTLEDDVILNGMNTRISMDLNV